MKKIKSVSIILFFLIISPLLASASTLNCSQIDGMAIFGYDGDEWIHIGAIGNEYSSLSIANEFGAGNEFKSTSIFNDYGRYGGEYSSQSAFNDYASKPPIIVNSKYQFVGYLTTNDYKTPNINTYEAIACAKKSYKSPDRAMEDIAFKSIPNSNQDYTGTYAPPLPTTCPTNSSYINGQCICNTGYKASGSVCITYTQSCQNQYGANAYGDSQYCYCSAGYQWNTAKTACIQTPSCPEGYTLNLNNQCITYTQSCQNVNNNDPNIIGTKGENGKINCNCISNYNWNGSQCIKNINVIDTQKPTPESKKEKPVIVETPQKTIKQTTTLEDSETKSATSSSASFSIKKIIATSTATTTATTTTTPKIPWYKKIWKFILRLF